MNDANGKGTLIPFPIDELWHQRTDYEDYAVTSMGGLVLRVYGLTGTARAALLPEMAALAAGNQDENDPAVTRKVLEFQTSTVAASLGYAREDWTKVGDVLPSTAIEEMFAIAMRLSGLDVQQREQATQRLRRRRSTASGIA